MERQSLCTEMPTPPGAISITGTLQEYIFFKAKSHNAENKLATFSAHGAENSRSRSVQYALLYPGAWGLAAIGGAPGGLEKRAAIRERGVSQIPTELTLENAESTAANN